MSQSRWYLHPIFIFILSTVALAVSLFLYIYWYMEVNTVLSDMLQRFDLDRGQVLESRTWIVILVLSLLVGIILIGILIIFVYQQKIYQLYRLQQNFINNFTHELKTPVTSLRLYLDTALKYQLYNEDQIKYIRYMTQDVARLSNNINRILNIAKIESRSYGGEFLSLDIVAEIERFLLNHADQFRKSRIHFHHPSDQPYEYRLNPSLFEMLMMNLLTNALKYNTSDTPEIDITIEHRANKLYLHFADNGIGLEKSQIRKIFRKFYQVGKSDDMTAKGSGLGLYLVETIVRIHKGKIIARSQGIGKGSIFTVILPYTAAV
jgi:two-component system, OmpR family, phosphate regulon sensor histidine kinase PhoR